MLLVLNHRTEPCFNMACEEYLLQTSTVPTVMLWRNEPAVIIGKNQNARENVDFDFTDANGIKVVRRLTGGGAVFHDLGNINYTFIVPESDAPESFRNSPHPCSARLPRSVSAPKRAEETTSFQTDANFPAQPAADIYITEEK